MVVESTKIGDFQAELLAPGRVDLPIFVLSTTISSFGYQKHERTAKTLSAARRHLQNGQRSSCF